MTEQIEDCPDEKPKAEISVLVEPELLRRIEEKAKSLNIDVPTFIRWCICTGLMLEDLNVFVKSKWKDGSIP